MNYTKNFLKFAAVLNCLLSWTVSANSQTGKTEEVVRRVANNIIKNTSFQFKNTRTLQTFSDPLLAGNAKDVQTESRYNRWEYPNGVIAVSFMELAKVLNDTTYSNYELENYRFIFENAPYFKTFYPSTPKIEWFPFFRMQELDDCGAMAAGLADVNVLANKKEYHDYLSKAVDYISTKQLRLKDGTLSRNNPHNATVWADDLYMSVPLLARMGSITGNKKYFNDAIKQVVKFNEHLYDASTGLYYHGWYDDIKQNGVAHWGRCNGWVALAQVELLNHLPVNHPKRPMLISLLQRQIAGFCRFQDNGGLWHQLIDKPDSYLETSVTAMFVYTIAKAVNNGWINSTYLSVAKKGWDALASKIDAEGRVEDVCLGTGIFEDLNYYYNRRKVLNDAHALGAVILAGCEMIKNETKKKR
jgi:rhamnogalacturonyl hydrolase YesR